VTAILVALLKRPLWEIAGIVGLLVVIIVAIGFAVYLIFRGLAYLHIKKIGVTGIECAADEPKRRKSCAKKN
jgi:drug/metabolite transporter (DMT)-like permease